MSDSREEAGFSVPTRAGNLDVDAPAGFCNGSGRNNAAVDVCRLNVARC